MTVALDASLDIVKIARYSDPLFHEKQLTSSFSLVSETNADWLLTVERFTNHITWRPCS